MAESPLISLMIRYMVAPRPSGGADPGSRMGTIGNRRPAGPRGLTEAEIPADPVPPGWRGRSGRKAHPDAGADPVKPGPGNCEERAAEIAGTGSAVLSPSTGRDRRRKAASWPEYMVAVMVDGTIPPRRLRCS